MTVKELVALMPGWTYMEICDRCGDAILPDYLQYLQDSPGHEGVFDNEIILRLEAVHFTHAMRSGLKVHINTQVPF